jgi:predicted GNAT family acetyltransferase
MKIKRKQTQTKGSFYVDLEGKGAGVQILNAAVEYARQHQIKIIPLCPFVKSVLDKKEEIRDILSA